MPHLFCTARALTAEEKWCTEQVERHKIEIISAVATKGGQIISGMPELETDRIMFSDLMAQLPSDRGKNLIHITIQKQLWPSFFTSLRSVGLDRIATMIAVSENHGQFA